VRVVGVAATTKSRSIGEEPRPCLYFPLLQTLRGNDSQTGMTLVLRTAATPAALARDAMARFRSVDPAVALFDVRTMQTHLTEAMFFPRATAVMFGLAGLMGLAIATIGIYGVVSFAVARRTKEIGIRLALGATRSRVVAGVLAQELALASVGAVAGLGLAAAVANVAASLLYGVSATDLVTFTAVPAFLLAVVLVASITPARRAASRDPMIALRAD